MLRALLCLTFFNIFLTPVCLAEDDKQELLTQTIWNLINNVIILTSNFDTCLLLQEAFKFGQMLLYNQNIDLVNVWPLVKRYFRCE
ncbi:hypothetical protein TcasGA2_TC032697 [Tribolium castaneum]|uniref:Uncharacterized protein n=1 Tax=Tribolium castaneum TaxID=7070 RepID=A0A139WJX1_TRICA|nr:hypothetical protein TcasGA2_TC032697 [Tribolium castaneum]